MEPKLDRLIEDVCVIGGGPAGATVAHRLARLGYRVCLIERQRTSQRPAGEALASSIRQPLAQLGLWEPVDRSALRCERMRVRWREDGVSQQDHDALIVDRAVFDRTLRAAGAQAGVTVLCPARARRASRTPSGWIIPVDGASGAVLVEAQFLVDASGRRASCRPAGPPTIALCGRWQGAVPVAPAEMRVEAGEHAWYWAAPVSHETATAQVFIDPQSHALVGSAKRETLYRSLLARSRLLRQFLHGLSLGDIRLRDATCRMDGDVVTPHSIKVGDRAFAADPLSSQGIQAAVRSGLQAGAVIHTILQGGDVDAALEFYRSSQQGAARAHGRHASEIYASQGLYSSSFWQARATPPAANAPKPTPSIRTSDNSELRLSQLASLVALPVIEGDSVRRRTALAHPGLERPVAWLGGVPLGPVLSAIGRGRPAASLLAEWSHFFATPAQARALLDWMIEHEILVNA